VVIGQIARLFTATAETPALAYPGLNQAAANIVITETARGAIVGALVLELPHDVSLNTTVAPRARVTAGDLRIGTATVVDGRINIRFVGASTTASTITIERISYDVTRAAMEGNVSVRIIGTGGRLIKVYRFEVPWLQADMFLSEALRLGRVLDERHVVEDISAEYGQKLEKYRQLAARAKGTEGVEAAALYGEINALLTTLL
jgi:hypothetical protein